MLVRQTCSSIRTKLPNCRVVVCHSCSVLPADTRKRVTQVPSQQARPLYSRPAWQIDTCQGGGAMVRTDMNNLERETSGVAGLDMVLGGGFPRNRLYLVQGEPGAGKTTFGLQFLREGLSKSQKVMYVSFSESRDELASIAASHGWTLERMEVMVVPMGRRELEAADQYTVFHPAEIELGTVMQKLLDEVKRLKPDRLVIDSLSEMRLLAGEPLRYRRQILALKEALAPMQCTVVLLDTCRRETTGADFETLVYGAVTLDQFVPAYGRKRRRLRMAKLRGVNFDDGYHDYKI